MYFIHLYHKPTNTELPVHVHRRQHLDPLLLLLVVADDQLFVGAEQRVAVELPDRLPARGLQLVADEAEPLRPPLLVSHYLVGNNYIR